MKILRVAQDMYPEVVGGGSYHTHAMSRDQASMGHDVTTVTVSKQVESRQTERRDGYRLVKFPPTITVLGNDISYGSGRFILLERQSDVVHAHSHVYPSTNIAALRRLVDDVPLAITCHGIHSVSVPDIVSKTHLLTAGRATYNAADVVFCYTDVEKRKLREVGVTTDIRVVHNGIDHKRFHPDGGGSDRIDDGGVSVLFVGRLSDGKRPDDAIRIVERVSRSRDVTLYLCGSGPLRSKLEQMVRERGLEDAVEFIGTVDYEEMPSLYRTADLFLLPTEAEGFPRTVLESLASATPVVMSRLEQVAPVVDAAGRTVPVGDIDAFSDAVLEFVDSSDERAELGQTGREIVEEEFGWDETVRQTTDHLEEIL